ncbi:MAG: thioredoxin family protein [Sedimentisphaerales bacterium]|nr:thioredoxin family protein [Sedimentisphaerales bacterium]
MRERTVLAICAVSVALLGRAGSAVGETPGAVEIVRHESQYSRAHVEPARLSGKPGLAVVFEGTKDLHYYASDETAPAPGLKLKVEATSDSLRFEPALFPRWEIFNDAAIGKVQVYVGDFLVFVPIRPESIGGAGRKADVTVRIAGIACTSQLCLPPFERTLTATVALGNVDSWKPISLGAARVSQTQPAKANPAPPRSMGIYYLLAILAGLSINVMPCVLPVLPIILMRLIGQADHSSRRRIASGLAFCAGVIFFFAVFALVSAIINVTTGAVLDLNSLFRYPAAVIVLFLAIVFFGLAMLDVVSLTLPSAIASGEGAAYQMAGSAGMGFFAAILSTPCSGALLGFVLVWAQTQSLAVSSTAIVLMGVGMAMPYAVIVLVPSLLKRLPRPGHWMDIFKKSTGFLLFFIAVKLTLAALPKDRLLNVLTYGIVFSFCVWMWGKWTSFSTPAPRTWTIRAIALLIAIGAGLWLLPARGQVEGRIDWQPYDAGAVQNAVSQGRPVLLKFTADWCTNCKVVERRVYHDPQVAQLIQRKNVLPIKADTTLIDYPATKDLKQIYGEAGNVPVTIIIRPDASQEKLRGTFDKEELIKILDGFPEVRS